MLGWLLGGEKNERPATTRAETQFLRELVSGGEFYRVDARNAEDVADRITDISTRSGYIPLDEGYSFKGSLHLVNNPVNNKYDLFESGPLSLATSRAGLVHFSYSKTGIMPTLGLSENGRMTDYVVFLGNPGETPLQSRAGFWTGSYNRRDAGVDGSNWNDSDLAFEHFFLHPELVRDHLPAFYEKAKKELLKAENEALSEF